MERLKKLGGSVAFGYFMNSEMTIMQAVLEEIRSNLLAIKSAAEQPTIHSPTVFYYMIHDNSNINISRLFVAEGALTFHRKL